MKAIADTGFLVAFANRRDLHHVWAVKIAEQVSEPLLTCEAVLAETAFHLGSASLVLSFVEYGLMQPAFQMADHIPRLKELAVRYADRAPDLADLCLIRLSELHAKYPVITTDLEDFRVYRQRGSCFCISSAPCKQEFQPTPSVPNSLTILAVNDLASPNNISVLSM